MIVDGHVKGDVRGAQVTLMANAHVDGDIFHSTLAVEQGPFFVGRSRSCDNPIEAKSSAKAARRNKPANVKNATGKDAGTKGGNGYNGPGVNGSATVTTLSLSKDDVIKGPDDVPSKK